MKMMGKKNKYKDKKFKFTGVYFFVTIFAVLLASFYLFKQYSLLKSHQNQVLELNKEIENQKKINKELQNEKEYKNSDENIEKIAREKLGMVRSNEIIFYDTNK